MRSNIGIHQFKNYRGSSSYFVQRKFGNCIVFADHLQKMEYDFLKSKGGVYRQFLESPKNIQETQIEIFDRFGASLVVPAGERDDLVHPQIPIERFGSDFSDPMTEWDVHGSISCLRLEQRGQKVAFFGQGHFLDRHMNIIFNGQKVTEQVVDFLRAQQIFLAFFARHEGNPIYETKRSYFVSRLIEKIF